MAKPAPWRQAGVVKTNVAGSNDDPNDELAELRRLLDIPDSVEWAELRSFWLDRERRARDLGERLPDAVRLRTESDNQLRDALQPVIEEGLKLSVRRNPQVITEALFPLIGTMVRRSVAASLAQLNENVNQTLESSLSLRSVAWRWEASRRGVPFSRVLLERSLRFRVEQAFLIDRRAGLLLLHRTSQDSVVRDPTVISGMLTAIQDFVQDSFSGPEEMLESVRMGEHTVWINSGPRAVLTCVVRGAVPPSFKTVMEESLGEIHREFAKELEEFSGDTEAFAGAAPVLDACLLGQAPRVLHKAGMRWLWATASLLLLAAAAFGIWRWTQNRHFEQYVQSLRSQPGIVVNQAERVGGKWHVKGLRDPMAVDPLSLAGSAEVDPAQLEMEMTPYLSPDYSPQRAAAEAAQRVQSRVLTYATNSAKVPDSAIDFLAADIRLLDDFATLANRSALIHVTGSADTVGDAAHNNNLATQRAENVVDALTASGLPAALFDVRVRPGVARFVNFEVEMTAK